jgi:hypothetical protein
MNAINYKSSFVTFMALTIIMKWQEKMLLMVLFSECSICNRNALATKTYFFLNVLNDHIPGGKCFICGTIWILKNSQFNNEIDL